MAYRNARPRWNSYRPTYGFQSGDYYTPNYTPEYERDSLGRSSYASRSLSPPVSGNPNRIPIANSATSEGDAEMNNIIGVTRRALKLIANYEKESMGGTRWTAKDIEMICKASEDFSSKVEDFHSLRGEVRQLTWRGPQDLIEDLDDCTDELRKYCYLIQDFIADREKLPQDPWTKAFAEKRGDDSPLGISSKGAAAREMESKTDAQYSDDD